MIVNLKLTPNNIRILLINLNNFSVSFKDKNCIGYKNVMSLIEKIKQQYNDIHL